MGPDGSVYVVAEASPGLFRVPALGGRAVPIGGVVQADDIVSDGALLYATLIGLGNISFPLMVVTGVVS